MGSSEPERTEFLLVKEDKVSEKDRREILETIDRVVAENRLTVSPGLFALKPKKNGLLFPLVINLAALAAVAVGFFVANLYFSRQQSSISNQAGTFFSAEGKLLEAVRKQSQAELAAKDQQIESIQGQLGKLDQEAAGLRKNMDATIAAKEQNLRAQMSVELDAEKARLQKLGISQEDVNRRLQEYQNQISQRYDRQLSSFQQQVQTELAAREKQIQTERERQQQILAQANQEKQNLQVEAQTRESQMRSQFEAQQAQLQTQNQQLQTQASAAQALASQAQAKLQALSSQSQNEQLIDDQIAGSYNSILADIKDNKLDQAQQDMTSLRALLENPKIDTLPDIAKRRPIDLALIGTLQNLIKEKSQVVTQTQGLDPATAQAANELLASQALVAKADAAQASGDAKTAVTLYTRAITQIPAFNKAFTAIQGYDASHSDQQLSATDASSKELLAQRDATIQSLRNDSAAKADEIARLNQNLAAAQTTVAALKGQIAAQGQKLDQLTQSAGSTGADVTELQKQAAQQAQTIDSLKAQLAGASAASSDLKAQLASNEAKLKELNQQIAIDDQKLAYYIYGPDDLKTAEKKSRDAALDDVLLLTFYFSGQHGAQNPATVKQINEVAGQDPLYRDAAATIQSLALNGSFAAPVLQTQFKLIGPVSFISPGEITVERLANVPIKAGASVMFRHKNTAGAEIPVAVGKVSGVSADRVEVTITSLLQGSPGPKMLDLAYLEAPSGI